MIRIHVICEGQTEEMFINEMLVDLYATKGICWLPSLIGKPGHKGGNVRFERLQFDIRARLLRDTSAYCTTFFDFYGLPPDFPGKKAAQKRSCSADKARCVTRALNKQLQKQLGEKPLRRFIPYVQMHEFEGLLFSEPELLASGLDQTELADGFRKTREQFDSPEAINDGSRTAPSKRIKTLFPGYEKPLHGSLAALEIGLDAMRRECTLFNQWLNDIERLVTKPT